MKKKIIILSLALIIICATFIVFACSCDSGNNYNEDGSVNYSKVFKINSKGTLTSVTKFGKTLEEIVIPEEINGRTVTGIGEKLFYHSQTLKSIEIPDSVTNIEYAAFDTCSNLASVKFGENSQLETIGNVAFNSCVELSEIEIPGGVKTIGINAFGNCYRITNITLPSGLTSISECAFWYTGIESIEIPSGVTSIDENAFEKCGSLEVVTFASDSQLTSIGGYAFSGCDDLKTITLPSGVTSIGRYAFSGTGLITIEIPSSVTSIGECAFEAYDLLTAGIPSSVTSIGEYAFTADVISCEAQSKPSGWSDNWAPLEEYEMTIVVWNSVLKDQIVYELNDSVATVARQSNYLSGEVEILSQFTHNGKTYSVTSIADEAFAYSYRKLTVIIPSSITRIGVNAFKDCDSLTIYCESASQPSGWSSSWNCNCPVVWGYTGL